MRYWTSDTHFGHDNIIRYCSRPFANVHEMNAEIIFRWNKVVKPEDTVYHLGDFAMRLKKDAMAFILGQLNGQKILVGGNHDPKDTRKLKGWTAVVAHAHIPFNNERERALLVHDPEAAPAHVSGGLVLHGHHHGQTSKHPFNPLSGFQYIDVGVDAGWAYTPVSEEQIINRLKGPN